MIPRTTLLTAIAIGAPWLGAIVVAVVRRQPRILGFLAALIAAVASFILMREAPARDSLDEALMVIYACLTLGALCVIPRRDTRPGTIAGILFLLGASLLAYSTDDIRLLLGAWTLTVLPFFPRRWFGVASHRPRFALAASSITLAAAIALIVTQGHGFSIEALRGRAPGGMAVFALLVLAVIFRKGICPAHAWVADAASDGNLVPTALLLNGHFGAMLVARLIMPLFPSTARDLFPLLSYLALATAVYIAIRALTENAPRRLIAFIALSQSAAILAGLESHSVEGITGALVHWIVVTTSTMGLFGIVRLLEVRFGENLTASHHFGLAQHAPRLAVFFLIFGLALIGLPGTLSFCSQDLLIHGTLESHAQTGLLLPIATAMNAVSIIRLFARLFLGKRRTGFTVMADAMPRERWALAAGVVFVVVGGIFPNTIVARRTAEAEAVTQSIPAPGHSQPAPHLVP